MARVGETLQNLAAVFSKQRRREPVQHRSGGKPHRVGDTAGHVKCWVFDLNDQSARKRLRIVECFADSLDRGSWDILRDEAAQPLVGRRFREDGT